MSLLTHLAFILITNNKTDEENVIEGTMGPIERKYRYPVAVNEPHDHILRLLPGIAKAEQAKVRLVEGYDFQTLESADIAGFWVPAEHRMMRTAIAFLEPTKGIARLIFRDKPAGLPLVPMIFGNQPDVLAHRKLNLIHHMSIPILMSLKTIREEDGRT